MHKKLLTLALGLLSAMAMAQCPPAAPLSTPYSENFDSQSAGYQATFGNCYIGTTSSNPRWEFESSGTGNSTGTGPLNDASGTGIYAYLETSGGALGDTSGLITPQISLVGLSNPELRYLYHMFGATMGSLQVYVNDGSGWTLENTITGQQQTAETDCWLPAAVSLSSYVNDTVRIKFVGTRGSSFTGDVSIDEIEVDEALNCPVPLNLSWIASTSSSADLRFDAVASATSGYRVYVGTPGFNPSTATPQTFTNDTVTLTGLSPATTYEAYVESDCGSNGLSGPSICAITFQTSCVPFNTFYTRDFDVDADGAVPQCWAQYNNYDPLNAYARAESVTNAYSGGNVLEMYSYFNFSAGDTLMAISPEFSDMTSNTRQIKFYASSQSATNTLIVGTTNSQVPGAPINVLDTISLSTSWQLTILPLNASSGYNGTDKYIVFKHGLENTFSDIYIDDFVYEAIPACPQLTNISLSNVGITTASFTYNSGGNPVQFEYGPVGYQQGTGTTGNITSGTGTITGLSSANCYDVYLRTDCTSGGNGTSVWSGPFTVCTLCLTQTLPYSENFDIGLGCFVAQDGGTTSDTWVQVTSSTTTSSPTGLDGSPGWVEADSDNAGSGSITMDEVLLSPYIDAGSISGTLYLEFDQFYQHLGSNAIVEVWDGSSWIGLLNQTSNIGAFGSPDHQKIDLTAYANDSLQVRFVYKDNGAWAWWWLIDNVLIQEELCARSTNFQAAFALSDSIGLSWDPGSGGTFSIEYGPAGFSPGSGTIVSTTDSSLTIAGLSAQTTYDFYLVDSCGGIASLPVFLSATTSCALSSPAVLPLVEDFESYTVGPTFTSADQLCNPSYLWSMDPDANGQFRLQAGASYLRNGLQAMTVDQSTFASNLAENEFTMTVDLSNYTTANGITLSFYYMRHTTTSRPGNRVLVRGSAADTWVQIGTMNSPNSGSYDSIIGLDIVAPLAQVGQSVGPTTQIKIIQSGQSNAFSNTCCDGFTIDDLRLDAVSCPKPGNLAVSSLFDTTATLNWAGTSGNYQYWFGPAGFYQGTTTTAGVKAISSSSGVVVDTLSQFTCYEFLVRSICSAGDSSSWEGPFQFCTPCSPVSAPYFEDWDAYSSASKDVGCYGIIEDASFSSSTFQGVTIQDFTFYNPISPLNFVELDNGSTTTPLILVSPPTTDLDGGDKRVEFFARSTFNATPPSSIIVGTLSDGSNPNTFHPIDTVYPDGAAFTQYTVEFTTANGYNGTDMFYGFMHGQDATFRTVLIDDVLYENIPTCVRPTALQQDSADLNLIHLSWTSNGTGNSWEIEYGPVGFSPGTGTTVIANSNPYTLTGLTSATAYDVYITEICAPGDSSRQVGPEQMSTTVCAAANQCWFNFDLLDSFGDGWNGGLVEIRQNGVTVATLGTTFTTGSIVSDSLLLCDNFSTTIVVTNAGGWPSEMGIVMYTPWGDTAVHYPASGTTGLNTIMGTFTALCTPPTCNAPSQISQTSAGLTDIGMSFTANGTGSNYEISFGVPGHMAGSGTILSTTSTTYTITGLSSATTYDVYVREICGPGDTSAWAGPEPMSTSICAAADQCTFDFDLTDSFGDGWNGAEITVYQNGIEVGKLGQNFNTGSLYQDSLSLCDSLPTTIILTTAGGWPSEIGFYVYNPNGDTAAFYLSNFTTAQGDTMANFIAYCTGSPSSPCAMPDSVWTTSNIACDEIEVDWNSNTGGSLIEYGPAGFTPGSGTLTAVVTAPYLITGLTPGTAYDVYVADTCGTTDTSAFNMISTSTASGPLPVASFTIDSAVVGSAYEVYVDASASTDADSYEWNFGNGVTSTAAADTMIYLGNGSYTITLVVSNACGSDTMTYNINVNIGLDENPLAHSLNVYPNPADYRVNISFTAINSANAVIRLVDAQGREVLRTTERAAGGKFDYNMDVSDLASGIYMIEITSGELTAHRRLSVK